MHKPNEDCFYFLTSTCAKGVSCAFRHSPLAQSSNVICPAWIRGVCLDPACPLRHSYSIQRPTATNNGILCFYENTPTGCLKPDCTFIHSRPRHLLHTTSVARPTSTNLVVRDTLKPTVTAVPSTGVSLKENISQPTSTNTTIAPVTNTKTEPAIPVSSTEKTTNVDRSLTSTQAEASPRRTAVLSENEQSIEKVDSTSISTKISHRSVITSSLEGRSDDTIPTQSRLVVSRNVIFPESVSSPTRVIVKTPSSNRIVLSSESASSSQLKRNEGAINNISGSENDSKKFKSESQPTSVLSSVNSTTTTTGNTRILCATTKPTTPTNQSQQVQINRESITKNNGITLKPVSASSEKQKIIAGTGLSPEDARRTSRLERFKSKPISLSPTKSANESLKVQEGSSPNENKRTAPTSIRKDLPPSKRLSTVTSPCVTKASLHRSSSLTPSISNKNSDQPTTSRLGLETKSLSSPATTPDKSTRPPFKPEPIRPPSPVSSSKKLKPIRQPPSVTIKRTSAPVMASKTTVNPSEDQNKLAQDIPSTPKLTSTLNISNSSNVDEENQLLKLNESNSIVDTCALIDEVLLEADHLLELL